MTTFVSQVNYFNDILAKRNISELLQDIDLLQITESESLAIEEGYYTFRLDAKDPSCDKVAAYVVALFQQIVG